MLTLETVVEQQRLFSHEGLSWVKESMWSKHPLCAILWWVGGRWTEASREVWVSPRVGGLSWFFRQSLERPCTSQKNKQTNKKLGFATSHLPPEGKEKMLADGCEMWLSGSQGLGQAVPRRQGSHGSDAGLEVSEEWQLQWESWVNRKDHRHPAS